MYNFTRSEARREIVVDFWNFDWLLININLDYALSSSFKDKLDSQQINLLSFHLIAALSINTRIAAIKTISKPQKILQDKIIRHKKGKVKKLEVPVKKNCDVQRDTGKKKEFARNG